MTRVDNKSKDGGAIQEEPKKGRIKEESMAGPMITLLMYSFAMLILPLACYFAINFYIVKSTTISAVGAVVTVQIIVGAYIYKAWSDEKNYRVSKKKD